MTTTITRQQLQENVVRQAKRLKYLLNIPLDPARNILARAAYGCSSWKDLMSRIESDDVHTGALVLSLLPDSHEGRDYLARNAQHISHAICQHVLTNCNLAGLFDVVKSVFDVYDRATELKDITDTLSHSPWRSSGIGPDPFAVIESHAIINGISIKLIGTRVYLPQFFNFVGEVAERAKYAVNFGEPFQIMWSAPHEWYDAALAYLNLSDDEEAFLDTDLCLPSVVLDEAMKQHEQWFTRVLTEWRSRTCYGCDEDMEFAPVVMAQGTYLIFGFPCSLGEFQLPLQKIDFQYAGDEDGDCKKILIEDQPVCLELMTYPPANEDVESWHRYTSLRESIFSHPQCDLEPSTQRDRPSFVMFITPSSQFDVRMMLNLELMPEDGVEALVVKTDNIALAVAVFEKVADRDVCCYRSVFGTLTYTIELNVPAPDDFRGFGLALDVVGKPVFSGTNLVTSAIFRTTKNKRTVLYVQLNDRLFSLVQAIGLKALIEAVKHGLVLTRKAGFLAQLDRLPRWCSSLQPTPNLIVREFDRPLSFRKDFSFFDILRNTRITRYRRDNY